jgi:membrane-associated phospholipid phosphatase
MMSSKTITSSYAQDTTLDKNDSNDLRSSNLLAKWPVIGLGMFIFGSLVFGALTYNLYNNGPLLAWDRTIANTLPEVGLKSPPIVKPLMDTGFYLGEQVITVFNVILFFYFLYKRYWREFSMLVVGQAGSFLIFYSLSNLIARQRPPTQIWIVLKIPGYPSGHAIGVIVFYGLMAYLLAPKMRSAFGKVLVVAAALFIIGFVGFSRVFTAGHYLTDVLAGYSVGIAYTGAIYTLIEIYFQKRKKAKDNLF